MQEIQREDIFQNARIAHHKLSDDTREICTGDIFVLRQGAQPLLREKAIFLAQQAVESGAAGIIADPQFKEDLSRLGAPVLTLRDPHLHLRALAEGFWGNPSMDMKIIAVTGTNGKTTTTYLIESLAKAMGLRVGVLGTISHRYPGYEESSINTTPGTLKLFRLMREMADARCDLLAMEVSSHGIMQGRIDGIAFDAAIWNNLGTDHLDFHQTREAYALAKQRLYDHYLAESCRAGKSPVAVGNADDDEVMAHIRAACPENWGGRVLQYSCGGRPADIQIMDEKWENGAWKIAIDCGCRQWTSALPLVGQYNVKNAAGALTALYGLGYDITCLADSLPKIGQIPGRMECVNHQPTVIVDFAHTPEALENALIAARQCVEPGGRLIAVFGAGGDRDPSKRPMMGQIASKLADLCYVTSDNPRTEDPDQIIAQIVQGMANADTTAIESDRKVAIIKALCVCRKEDLVLIAGKGHEDYQIIGTKKHHFDDREIVREYFARQNVL